MSKILEAKTETVSVKASKAIEAGFALNQKVAKSSKEHKALFQSAAINAVLLVANPDIGNVAVLNDLWKIIEPNDRETLRLFMANVTAKYAVKITTEDGREQPVSMLLFRKETGFKPNFGNAVTNEGIKKAANEMRATIHSVGETGLKKLSFGPSADQVNRRAEADFDPFNFVKRSIATLVKRGYDDLAKVLNKDIGVHGYNEDELAALKPDHEKQLEAALKRVETIKSRMGTTEKQEEPVATEKEAAQAANAA